MVAAAVVMTTTHFHRRWCQHPKILSLEGVVEEVKMVMEEVKEEAGPGYAHAVRVGRKGQYGGCGLAVLAASRSVVVHVLLMSLISAYNQNIKPVVSTLV